MISTDDTWMEKNYLDPQNDFLHVQEQTWDNNKVHVSRPEERIIIQGSTVPCKIDSNLTDQHMVMHKPFCSIFWVFCIP